MQKNSKIIILTILGLVGVLMAWVYFHGSSQTPGSESKTQLEDDPWKEVLTPEQYAILRDRGTEEPYSSPLIKEKRKGTYYAADTKKPVFRSEQKYDSGTGWPSFWAPVNPEAIRTQIDNDLGFERTEVISAAGGHLGHVFTDGPDPTGLRYCINGDALYFVPDEEEKKSE